jgi:hypothetical protein
MAVTASSTRTTTIAGVTITTVVNRSEEEASRLSLDMPAGIAGTITTRTDADTGVLTVSSGHGITTSDIVSVFWADGTAHNFTVSATTSTTITIDAGDGDDLPVVTTAIVVSKQQPFDLLLDGDSLVMMVIKCANRAMVDFRSSAPASLLQYIMAANEGRDWASGLDITNPLAGDTVATVHVANGATTAASVEIGLLKTAD